MLHKRRLIISLLLLAIVGLSAFVFIRNTGFRVVDQMPKGDVAMSSTLITLKVSDTPVNTSEIKFSIKPEVKGEFSVEGDAVFFKPSEAFKENGRYTISIENVRLNNSNSIHKTNHTFKAVYIPYDKLSKEEKDRQLAKTNPQYETYPITKILPYVTSSYKIEYTLPSHEKEKFLLVVTPLIEQNRGESTEQYQARLLAIKTDAEAYIASNGFNLSDYALYYPDLFLIQYSTVLPNNNE
ncbi:hypothetical protein D3C85_801150 [compost metagenome]